MQNCPHNLGSIPEIFLIKKISPKQIFSRNVMLIITGLDSKVNLN